MSKLVLFMPDGTTVDVPLARERTMIGRRGDNDISLPNLAVSGEHAVVVTILADSFLEDLGSTNGTLVNGNPIAKHFLRDRDQIEIGRHKLIYCADDSTMIEGEVVRTMEARVAARGLGEVVESARPFVRAAREAPPPVDAPDAAPASPRIKRDDAPPSPRVTAEAPPVAAAAAATATAQSRPPAPVVTLARAGASIKILTGSNAGVSMPLTKAETTIGRPGLQVAVIVRRGELFLLKSLEGGRPLTINDQAVADGTVLTAGDVIAIAGTRIEFVTPEGAPAEAARRG